MHRLRHEAEAEGGRLLCVLLLWLDTVSTNSGSTLRFTGHVLLLCVTSDDQCAESGRPIVRLCLKMTCAQKRSKCCSVDTNFSISTDLPDVLIRRRSRD